MARLSHLRLDRLELRERLRRECDLVLCLLHLVGLHHVVDLLQDAHFVPNNLLQLCYMPRLQLLVPLRTSASGLAFAQLTG